MAQVHTFSNPFLNAKQEDKTSHSEYSPFSNYKTMPWFNGLQMEYHWFETQQKFWQEYWEWASWQQQMMQQNIQDSSRLMMHCMQLSANPPKLARFLRMNWQKPYLTLNAQALTSSRLLTKMMTNCFGTLQNEKKH